MPGKVPVNKSTTSSYFAEPPELRSRSQEHIRLDRRERQRETPERRHAHTAICFTKTLNYHGFISPWCCCWWDDGTGITHQVVLCG